MRRRPLFLLLALMAALGLAACGPDAVLDRTVATLEIVRGGAHVGETAAARVVRLAAGEEQAFAIDEGSLARLSLDGGAQLLMDAGARARLDDEASLRIEAGRVFAETDAGVLLELGTAAGTLRIRDAAISLRVEGETLEAYVVRGELAWHTGTARGITAAGQRLHLGGGEPRAEAEVLWHDWTGGLAQPGPGDATGPAGVGVLEARVPDEIGQARWPLVIRRLDVQVRITGDLAVTEVEQVFFNPASESVEGLYRVRVPEGAVLQRFAVDRNGTMVDGYVREQAQARQAYEAQVYRGSTLDPALLEWVAPDRYQARIYPIAAGESRRIVVRYAEWLRPVAEGQPRLYRYPMGGGRRAPRVQELSITADVGESGATRVRAGMGAAIEQGYVRLRRSDFAPRSDFWMELVGGEQGTQVAWRAEHEPPPRAPDAREVPGEADERDYWYVPLRLPESWAAEVRQRGLDLVVVADVSAGTDRSHLELGRSVVEALSAHLGQQDRLTVVTSDLAIRSIGGGEVALGDASAARVEALLDGLARVPAGGATDLGAALTQAAALLDPARSGAVIYVGDGAPTVGELEAQPLLDALARVPSPPRLYALAIGADARLDLLEVLSRGGGLALRVEERSAAADAALAVFAHASRPVAQRVTLDAGTGIGHLYPRRPVDVVIGDVLPVAGRIDGELPTQIRVHATIAGREIDEVIAVTTRETEQSADLRLRWAGERLRQLLLDGASREEVAELGTRYGLITPYTSFYVPSAQELAMMGPSARAWIGRPDLLAQARQRSESQFSLLSLALGPLALTGCGSMEGAEAPPQEEAHVRARVREATDDQEGGQGARSRDEEGAMGPADNADRSNRYGIQGPGGEERSMAREQAAQAGALQALGGDVAAAPAPPPQPGYDMRGAPATATVAPAEPAAAIPPAVQAQVRALGYDIDQGARPPSPDPAPTAGLGTTGSGYGGGGSGEGTIGLRGPPRPMRRARASTSSEILDPFWAEGERPRGGGGRVGGVAEAQHRIVIETSPGQSTITTSTTRIVFDTTHHARARCSDAASLPLDDRRALWRERLGQAGHAYGWVEVYRAALRDCEAPDWRDRRALLDAILAQAGGVQSMIAVYGLFDSGAARGYLRSAILRRVRSPEDLRAVRGAFGLGAGPDWTLVEQVLARAPNDEARLRALRQLVAQYPDDFDLKLRLLEMLETAERGPEARRLAERLRTDPRADAGVRTAIGELYLRMDLTEEARRVFSEIVEFAPLDELARRRLGDLYRAHGWFEDAYRQYETLSRIRPDDPSVLLLLAQAAAGAGRIDEALRLEQRLMETSEPGAERGIARVAMLWSSVRLAKLRAQAREASDEARLAALEQRMRRSGILREAGDLRVTLTWSHPDAQLSLWTAHPGRVAARPADLAPEHGLEAFDVAEQEDGDYRVEVRRADPTSPQPLEAELVLVWREGQRDEVVRVVPLAFREGREGYRWSLRGSELREIAD